MTPTPKLAIVELGARRPVNTDGRIPIAETEIVEPAQYEARFDELMATRRPWINLVCLGMYRSRLLVGVEFGNQPAKPSPRTSVNYSGPATIVSANGWDATKLLNIG